MATSTNRKPNLAMKAIRQLYAQDAVRGTAAPCRTRLGLKRIEHVEVGDRVWAYDKFADRLVMRHVRRLFRRQDRPVLRVVCENADGTRETITATTEHPFWVYGRGWVAANELLPGDRLRRIDLEMALHVLIVHDTDLRADVFNFEVDGLHNYFVGRVGALVHNSSREPQFEIKRNVPGLVYQSVGRRASFAEPSPGTGFRGAHDAALAAISEYMAIAQHEKIEFGGLIALSPHGRYATLTPIQGDKESVSSFRTKGGRRSRFEDDLPPGYTAVGAWHIHPKGSADDMGGEFFSFADVDVSNRHGLHAWVGTPSGAVLHYPIGGAFEKVSIAATGTKIVQRGDIHLVGEVSDVARGAQIYIAESMHRFPIQRLEYRIGDVPSNLLKAGSLPSRDTNSGPRSGDHSVDIARSLGKPNPIRITGGNPMSALRPTGFLDIDYTMTSVYSGKNFSKEAVDTINSTIDQFPDMQWVISSSRVTRGYWGKSSIENLFASQGTGRVAAGLAPVWAVEAVLTGGDERFKEIDNYNVRYRGGARVRLAAFDDPGSFFGIPGSWIDQMGFAVIAKPGRGLQASHMDAIRLALGRRP
jgi:hypothetical protein